MTASTATTYRLVQAPLEPVAAPALDSSQQAVVDHPGGPLLVLAGPGTGKTTTLVEAVVERVRRGAQPDDVLVLTFSRKAADELRERIASRLGVTSAEPAASTFHAWCYALVRASSPAGRPPRLLSQAERDVRIRELLEGHAKGEGSVRWPQRLRPALQTRGFAREVAAVFDRSRERGLDPHALRRLGESADRDAWVACAAFLDEYLAVLDLRDEVDYAGLVATATSLLADPETTGATRDRYDAVFVDEYQDTDPSQERLLQQLAGGGRDLVVVGDPDQSIYAFRGADVGGILEFPQRFRTAAGAEARVLSLAVSRRTGGALLAVSRRVAERLPTPGLPVAQRTAHRALAAAGPDGDGLTVRLHSTLSDQVTGIADLLRRAHLENGLPWSEMAVLVRSGRSLAPIRRSLVAAGIPVSVAADDVPLARDPAVAPLLLALRAASDDLTALRDTGAERSGRGLDWLSDADARVLLTSPLGNVAPADLRDLGRALRAVQRSAGAAIPDSSAALIREALVDPRELSLAPDRLARPVRRLHDLLAATRQLLLDGGTPEQALWRLWDTSRWGRRLAAAAAGRGDAARAADRDLDAIVALFDAAARLEERDPRATAAGLLEELEMQEIPAAAMEERPGIPDTVRLLTAHRSKGLEWDLVVVADVQDDVWPDVRRRTALLDADLVDDPEPRLPVTPATLLVEERRLFYVALTRARRRLVVTAVASVDDEGARPSRFLDEIVDELPPVVGAGTGLLSPGSLVARLRRVAQDDTVDPAYRQAAASRLAVLREARSDDGKPLVPAADPARWWGIDDWTPGAAAVRPVDEPVRLSASTVSSYSDCGLRWFLDNEVRAATAATAAQGFGKVIHALAKLIAEGELDPDVDTLVEQLDGVWGALGFEAAWHAAGEREQAAEALRRLVAWLADRTGEVAGSELRFDVTVGDARIVGAVDRVEVLPADTDHCDPRVRIVDFKTGRSAPTKAVAAQNPQLGVYQLVAREHGFAEVVPDDAVPGGGELVMLRLGTAAGMPKVLDQPALSDDTLWADELLAGTASGIREESFPARVSERCGVCPFRPVCPAHAAGDGVVR